MYAYNATILHLKDAAKQSSFVLEIGNPKGNAISFRISLPIGSTPDTTFASWSTDAWGNVTRKSRKHVCVHGHYLFFKYLFRIAPDAKVISSWYGRVEITKDNLDTWYANLAHRYTNSFNMTHTFGDRCACQREQMWHVLDGIHNLPLEPGNPKTTHYDLVKVSYSD